MFNISMFKDKLSTGLKKFSGRTDYLEAVCAATALVAAADGEISDSEVTAITKGVANNATLSACFKQSQIEKTCDVMLKRAQGGRAGRAGLYKEIDDIAKDQSAAEMVYLMAFDVADADGKLEAAERKTLTEIAKRLGVNEQALANV